MRRDGGTRLQLVYRQHLQHGVLIFAEEKGNGQRHNGRDWPVRLLSRLLALLIAISSFFAPPILLRLSLLPALVKALYRRILPEYRPENLLRLSHRVRNVVASSTRICGGLANGRHDRKPRLMGPPSTPCRNKMASSEHIGAAYCCQVYTGV